MWELQPRHCPLTINCKGKLFTWFNTNLTPSLFFLLSNSSLPLLPSLLSPSGLYRWEPGHGEVPGRKWSQCQPTRQRGLDPSSRSGIVWLSEHSRVSEFQAVLGIHNTFHVFLLGAATQTTDALKLVQRLGSNSASGEDAFLLLADP